MITFPNAKINLGLHIVQKRADGFHNLETIFYPVSYYDVLECIPSNEFKFTQTGIEIKNNENDNLVLKAYHLIKKDFPTLPPLNIHLHKHIPIGAGLGGGSADAATMLQYLNTHFELKITVQKLLDYTEMLGSDCPFFILNKPAYATEKGNVLQEIKVDLSAYEIKIIPSEIHINTKIAFSHITPQESKKRLTDIITQPIETWKDELHNDFEKSIFKLYPSIRETKLSLYAQGAIYASMSGSGSAVYGIFKK